MRIILDIKEAFGKLIGAASADNIAALVNATTAFNKLIISLVLDQGNDESNIVIDSYGFPTNYYTLHALKRKGLLHEIRYVRSMHNEDKVNEIQELIDRKTIAVVIDHVSWKTGVRADLKSIAEIAHDSNAFLISDAFHSVGSLPINVSESRVDAVYFGSYKWLMAPHGAAIMYLSNRVLNVIEPPCIGWLSIKDSVVERMKKGEPMFEREIPIDGFDYPSTAEKLEDGTQAIPSFAGLLASYEFITDFEWPNVYERVAILSRILREKMEKRVTQLYKNEESGIVVIKTPKAREIAYKLKKKHKIAISARPGFVRVSPHFYNTEDEVEKVADALEYEMRQI